MAWSTGSAFSSRQHQLAHDITCGCATAADAAGKGEPSVCAGVAGPATELPAAVAGGEGLGIASNAGAAAAGSAAARTHAAAGAPGLSSWAASWPTAHTSATDRMLRVMVPVLSLHSTSMDAASSVADRRDTSTPACASAADPSADDTVYMEGSATGSADTSSMSSNGTCLLRSEKLEPAPITITAATIRTTSGAPVHRMTSFITRSECLLGCEGHERDRLSEKRVAAGAHHHGRALARAHHAASVGDLHVRPRCADGVQRRLARERRLIDADGAMQRQDVRAQDVAVAQTHDVAGHALAAGNARPLPIAVGLGRVCNVPRRGVVWRRVLGARRAFNPFCAGCAALSHDSHHDRQRLLERLHLLGGAAVLYERQDVVTQQQRADHHAVHVGAQSRAYDDHHLQRTRRQAPEREQELDDGASRFVNDLVPAELQALRDHLFGCQAVRLQLAGRGRRRRRHRRKRRGRGGGRRRLALLHICLDWRARLRLVPFPWLHFALFRLRWSGLRLLLAWSRCCCGRPLVQFEQPGQQRHLRGGQTIRGRSARLEGAAGGRTRVAASSACVRLGGGGWRGGSCRWHNDRCSVRGELSGAASCRGEWRVAHTVVWGRRMGRRWAQSRRRLQRLRATRRRWLARWQLQMAQRPLQRAR